MAGELLARPIRPHKSGYWFPANPNDFYKSIQLKAGQYLLRDETDNNTHSEQLQAVCKPLYVMSEIFHREDERLKTFNTWPVVWLDKKELAMSGMFYMGEGDKTKCYFCEVEIGRWEPEDQPVPEHLRWSPNCPLLRRRTTNNVPINCEALERLLPPPSYDICGLNDQIEIRRNAFPEGTIPAADIPPASPATASSSGSSASSPNSGTFYPEYPEYAIETARLRTFAEWPRNMKQKPAQLAEAGFFYTGVGDRVKCFSCGGGLKDWDENDEPWEQHALWMGKCRYVKLIKGDTYIETVVNRFKKSNANTNTEEEGEQAQQTTANTNAVTAATVLTSNSITDPKETEQQLAVGATQQTLATAGCPAPEQNRKSSSTIPEEKLCKICYANEYNTAFLPCGHVVACAKCASSVTKCPLCRKAFADVMRVYFS
ncbi:death-associated inhibitor of apoptosis 1 [Lucilia cuprina]|uniref:death-associated inhibitor of apoptosis 1 n=1 Tax=Lucilia cuprina TaxID=7375 RepID=UPI000C71936B|nr:death-associated inhibitor of apoptosis 1 [Lucilia cuprina]XP_046809063.1 death-associated inhibitor of apoptosis 1 [Lucilia cuprina]XP_046809064.1 death-associated inhibitor of apoptosis 1 [Lucilia cuprina]